MLKTRLTTLSPVPTPLPDTILQVRTGKIKNDTLFSKRGPEPSAIAKTPHEEPVFVTFAGLSGDERAYVPHRAADRAVHQYSLVNYTSWQQEYPDRVDKFVEGAFGENFVAQNLTEENVCIGDVFQIGEEKAGVLLEVTEPRNPCYKLNLRFEWDKALETIRTKGRVGWNMRVLKEGYVMAGDLMVLVERKHPSWSVMNVQRVLRQREVDPALMEELAEISVVTEEVRKLAAKRLATASGNLPSLERGK